MKRTRRSGVERRDEIVQAALAIIAEQGTRALSVATVAHRVGVTPSALYRHYPDKDAIVRDMLARLGVTIRANLDRARSEAQDDAFEALGEFLTRHVEFIRANRGFPMLIFSDLVAQNPAHRELLLINLADFRGAIEDILRLAQQQGRVRRDLDVQAGAVAFFGLFMPAGVLWNMSGGRFDLTGQVRRGWTIFADGIRTPRPAGVARAARAPHRGRRIQRKEASR